MEPRFKRPNTTFAPRPRNNISGRAYPAKAHAKIPNSEITTPPSTTPPTSNYQADDPPRPHLPPPNIMADQDSYIHLARPLPVVNVPPVHATTGPLSVLIHAQVSAPAVSPRRSGSLLTSTTSRHFSRSSTTRCDGTPTRTESSGRSLACAAKMAARSKSATASPSATTRVRNKCVAPPPLLTATHTDGACRSR